MKLIIWLLYPVGDCMNKNKMSLCWTGAVTSDSGGLTSSITKLILPIDKGVPIKAKGANNDYFQITILND